MNRFKKAKGFSAQHILLVVVVLGLIALIGWLVWSRSHNKMSKASTASTPAVKTDTAKAPPAKASPTITVPDGWLRYEGDGFAFGYPQIFKGFKSDDYYKTATETAVTTEVVENQPFTGMLGNFVLTTVQSPNGPFVARKYGPTISLNQDEWKVVSDNPSDPKPYKAESAYNEYTKTTYNNTTVYSFTSGDEGTVTKTFVFVANGHLRTLQLPGFELGTYGPNGSATPRDEKPYNDLADQIVKTIAVN